MLQLERIVDCNLFDLHYFRMIKQKIYLLLAKLGQLIVSLIASFGTWSSIPADIKNKFSDQVKIRLISKLINGISRVLKKLLGYFNSTHILVFFVPSFSALPNIFFIYLYERLVSSLTGKSIILLLLSKAAWYL